MTETLQRAIDRSQSHDEIVTLHVEDQATAHALRAQLRQIWGGYTESVLAQSQHDAGGRGVLEVWGWTSETPDNEQDWRVHLTWQA